MISFRLFAGAVALGFVCFTATPNSAQTPSSKKSAPGKQPAPANKNVDDPDKKLTDLQKANRKQAEEIESLNESLTELKTKVDTSGKDMSAMKQAATQASESTMAAAVAAQSKIDLVTKSIEDSKAELDASKIALEERMKAMDSIKESAEGGKATAATAQVAGDTAWMLVSCAFVMLMLPGLALFYGGMVRRKNILATMMQSFACLSVVGLFWIAFGYGLAFGPSRVSIPATEIFGYTLEGGLIGWSWDLFFLQGISSDAMLGGYNIPVYVHCMFQGMFAIITPALISGALAERIRFWPFCIFTILWVAFVYCPLAHMVWGFDWFAATPVDASKGLGGSAVGLLGKLGALDFAGGTVVHIAAGMAGLVACLILRRREGHQNTVIHPNSMVITLLGAGLLWFGWFGFNGGSSLNSTALSGSAFAATQAAAASAGLGWILIEWLLKGKPTALGLASGIVAGLVAVTPASGFVYIWGGVAIGFAAAMICYLAVAVKNALGYDDSLDAFGIHGVGGFLGAILTGVFCYKAVNGGGSDGYFADGSLDQVKIQILAAVGSAVFAGVLSAILVWLTQALTLGNFTTDSASETEGLDRTEHGETGFDFGYATESARVVVAEPRAATVPAPAARFDLAVEGVPAEDIAQMWVGLCQPSDQPPSPDFLAVYPHVTTFSGNRFKCRGTDAPATAKRLESLFTKLLPGRPVKVVRL